MSNTDVVPAWRTEGVLMSRLGAYMVDLVIIGLWWVIAGFAIFIVGIITLSLGWGLFVFLPFIGILYSALTVGGRHQSTIGMRLCGLRVVRWDGGRVDMLTAAVHSLFFYVAASTFVLWLLDIFVGFFNENRRMLHDLLTGLAVVRA